LKVADRFKLLLQTYTNQKISNAERERERERERHRERERGRERKMIPRQDL
jgi:hypothetical protein